MEVAVAMASGSAGFLPKVGCMMDGLSLAKTRVEGIYEYFNDDFCGSHCRDYREAVDAWSRPRWFYHYDSARNCGGGFGPMDWSSGGLVRAGRPGGICGVDWGSNHFARPVPGHFQTGKATIKIP